LKRIKARGENAQCCSKLKEGSPGSLTNGGKSRTFTYLVLLRTVCWGSRPGGRYGREKFRKRPRGDFFMLRKTGGRCHWPQLLEALWYGTLSINGPALKGRRGHERDEVKRGKGEMSQAKDKEGQGEDEGGTKKGRLTKAIRCFVEKSQDKRVENHKRGLGGKEKGR